MTPIGWAFWTSDLPGGSAALADAPATCRDGAGAPPARPWSGPVEDPNRAPVVGPRPIERRGKCACRWCAATPVSASRNPARWACPVGERACADAPGDRAAVPGGVCVPRDCRGRPAPGSRRITGRRSTGCAWAPWRTASGWCLGGVAGTACGRGAVIDVHRARYISSFMGAVGSTSRRAPCGTTTGSKRFRRSAARGRSPVGVNPESPFHFSAGTSAGRITQSTIPGRSPASSRARTPGLLAVLGNGSPGPRLEQHPFRAVRHRWHLRARAPQRFPYPRQQGRSRWTSSEKVHISLCSPQEAPRIDGELPRARPRPDRRDARAQRQAPRLPSRVARSLLRLQRSRPIAASSSLLEPPRPEPACLRPTRPRPTRRRRAQDWPAPSTRPLAQAREGPPRRPPADSGIFPARQSPRSGPAAETSAATCLSPLSASISAASAPTGTNGRSASSMAVALG